MFSKLPSFLSLIMFRKFRKTRVFDKTLANPCKYFAYYHNANGFLVFVFLRSNHPQTEATSPSKHPDTQRAKHRRIPPPKWHSDK